MIVSVCDWKDQQDIQLEEEREKLLTQRATLIQRVVRGFLVRKQYMKMKKGCVVIQKTWKGYLERKKYERVSYWYYLFFKVFFVYDYTIPGH